MDRINSLLTLRGTAFLTLIILLSACGGGGGGSNPPPVQPPPATTGTIIFEVATTGAEPDTDGYSLALDTGTAAIVTPTSSTTFSNVPIGSHRLLLSNLDCNCAAPTVNPATVDVTGATTSTVHIDVACPAKSAQPQPVALNTFFPGNPAPFELVRYKEQMILVEGAGNTDTAVRGSGIRLKLLNLDSTAGLATEMTPPVADNFAFGPAAVLAGSSDVQVLYLDNQQCQGCMLSIGVNYARFTDPFTSTVTKTVAEMLPNGSSTDGAAAFEMTRSLALYQKSVFGFPTTYASRFEPETGVRATIIPLSTSRTRTSMALASASATKYLSLAVDEGPAGSITARPLTADGVETGALVTLETSLPTVLQAARPSIAWCGDRFAAVWWAEHSYVGGHVFLQLRGRTLDQDGVPLAATVNLTPAIDFTADSYARPIALSCLDDSGFAIAYADAVPSVNLVTTDLALAQTSTRNITVANGIASATGPHLIFDTKQFGIAWQTATSDAVRFSRVCRGP